MDEAFLALLQKKDFEYITVKEICAAAGVNRSTFYLHYETVGDLLTESLDHMTSQFLEYMNRDAEKSVAKLRTCPTDELYFMTPEYLTPYLEYIRDNKRLFRTATERAGTLGLEQVYGRMRRHVFEPVMERFGVPEGDRAYLMAFYIRGLMAIVDEWLRGDCADPVEHVVAVMQACVRRPGERRPED